MVTLGIAVEEHFLDISIALALVSISCSQYIGMRHTETVQHVYPIDSELKIRHNHGKYCL